MHSFKIHGAYGSLQQIMMLRERLQSADSVQSLTFTEEEKEDGGEGADTMHNAPCTFKEKLEQMGLKTILHPRVIPTAVVGWY